jgi:hypothetical protein
MLKAIADLKNILWTFLSILIQLSQVAKARAKGLSSLESLSACIIT